MPLHADAGEHQNESIMQGNNPEHCMACGSALEYLEYAVPSTCTYCGRVEQGHIRCPNGHFICNECHNADAMDLIKLVSFSTQSNNPFDIAEQMMSHPELPMLGCLHAYIAGGALMAALKNEGSGGVSDKDIEEVFIRTQKQAHGGYCGLTGVCGIAPALGSCFAVLTGSKCGKDKEQKITMDAVTLVTKAIAGLAGPSCCKAYVRIALNAAVKFMKKSLNIELPSGGRIRCKDMLRHPHGCMETRCPYFGRTPREVKHPDISK